MDSVISLGQKNTLAEYMILSGADNRPPIEYERIILESVEHGPLIWPTVEENGVIRTKKYAELSAAEKIQDDCDIKANNIILQGLPADIHSLVNHHRVAKDLWERVQLLMQAVGSLRFPSTNNQLRTSSNTRNQATIQNGKTEDLDIYDSNYDDLSTAQAVLMANISNYGSDVISEKAQRMKPTLYDGIVISEKHVAMPVIDDKETLILEEESRSKMSKKEKDLEAVKQNISHKPIDYEKLHRLTDDSGKHFTPQQELLAEQAF
uniref:Integrase, catalytic region, zinc finger, CCHC-type, peptidase aspartic, catalytic n=1 Tax=Tanacetum cinerariifolium TaxID=118510 RepID=A0A6L2NHT2_TANCI|nr:hypothetical protein [Tanacetum cinerariifolium]